MCRVGNLTCTAYAKSAYDACSETSPKTLNDKAECDDRAAWVPMWRDFIIHILSKAFGDASEQMW